MRKGLVLGALFAAAVAAGLIAEKPVSASEITRKTMRIESAYVMDDTGNVLQETEVRQEMEAEIPTVESLLKAAEEKKAAEERAAAEKAAAEAKAAEEKAAAEAKAVEEKADEITAYTVGDGLRPFTMKLGDLTDDEREIIMKGCLINYYRG